MEVDHAHSINALTWRHKTERVWCSVNLSHTLHTIVWIPYMACFQKVRHSRMTVTLPPVYSHEAIKGEGEGTISILLLLTKQSENTVTPNCCCFTNPFHNITKFVFMSFLRPMFNNLNSIIKLEHKWLPGLLIALGLSELIPSFRRPVFGKLHVVLCVYANVCVPYNADWTGMQVSYSLALCSTSTLW